MTNQEKLPAKTSTELSITDDGNYYVSKYNDRPANKQELKMALNKISAAFPHLDDVFLGLLHNEIIEAGISAQRLNDAVTYTIRNVHFPKIADILGYDKKTRLYKYHEIVDMVTSKGRVMSEFQLFDKDKKLWIDKNQL